MTIPSPLLRLANSGAPFLLLALTAGMAIIMQRTAPDNPGIVPFEFAGTYNEAARILALWGEEDRRQAILQTNLDFIFLVLYASTLSLFCFRAAGKESGYMRSFGALVGWGALAAGLLDAVENMAMLQTLAGSQKELFPKIAYYAAFFKFILVIGAMLFLIWFGVRKLADWMQTR